MNQAVLAEKFELIRKYEQQFSFRVANGMISKPAVSVWMVLLPFLFVYYMYQVQRYKTDVPAFADGFMRTKQAALDLAMATLRSDRPPTSAETETECRDEATPPVAAVKTGQQAEVALLDEHYRLLLAADGPDYASLLTSVYPTKADYLAFLERLQATEGDVNQAVIAAFHENPEGRETVQKMEKTARALRQAELKKFYG
ncbi:MAG: hypothetical protein FP813_10485 [Desulfurivibrio sp.]|nr:hypothetical protein [Desulfurivibrio sp.]MBU4117163.1 NF038143 family protein [Pseudomonadota bacterium]